MICWYVFFLLNSKSLIGRSSLPIELPNESNDYELSWCEVDSLWQQGECKYFHFTTSDTICNYLCIYCNDIHIICKHMYILSFMIYDIFINMWIQSIFIIIYVQIHVHSLVHASLFICIIINYNLFLNYKLYLRYSKIFFIYTTASC